MGRKRKPDPVRHCNKCGSLMARKCYGGRLESLSNFGRRIYCDQECMAADYEGTIKVLNAKNSRRQSAKKVKRFCERCGKGTTRLNVHHKDEDPLNNEPLNLETLCGSCHRKEHAEDPESCSHCDRPARHHGLCNTHWSRFRRHGDACAVVVWQDGKRVKTVLPS